MPDGIPSPNPQFPQSIKNVTGNANVKIQNKNLNSGLRLGYYSQNTGEYTESNNYSCSINPILVTENTTYIFSENGEIVDAYVYEFDINGNYLGRKRIINTGIYTPTSDVAYFNYTFKDGRLGNVPLNIKAQIEKGSTATSYVPHQEQNYPFTFSEGQRGMQGTPLLDDGIHNSRVHVIVNGTENWQVYSNKEHCFKLQLEYTSASGLCSHYQNIGATYFDIKDGIYLTFTNTIIISDLRFSNVEDFKIWLVEQYNNGTPLEVEYVIRGDEEIIPYNETQQAQYNNIKANASSYDDITYITSTSEELGFNMNAAGLEKSVNQVLGGSY